MVGLIEVGIDISGVSGVGVTSGCKIGFSLVSLKILSASIFKIYHKKL